LTRPRRSAEEARRLILEAAEKQLAERGPDGVRVQDVADRLGVVPATVLHHFGSRDELMRDLMTHGARMLRDRLAGLLAEAQPDLKTLSCELAELYASRRYAHLYATLSIAGEDPSEGGAGIFHPLLERIRSARGLRTHSQRERAANAVLVLNLVAFAEALVGTALRAAVGLPDDEKSRARSARWLSRLLDEGLGPP